MLRTVLSSVTALALTVVLVSAANAQEKKDTKTDKASKATITKVDAKNGTVTVKMKDKDGKDHDVTFHRTEDIRYFDSTGKVAAIDVFDAGNEVLVIEREGKVKEIHKHDKGDNKDHNKSTDKKPNGK